jgi:hypothetical protein
MGKKEGAAAGAGEVFEAMFLSTSRSINEVSA